MPRPRSPAGLLAGLLSNVRKANVLRETRHRLRELEQAIATQRKFLADLEGRGPDGAGERERLTVLLAELDDVLRASKLQAA